MEKSTKPVQGTNDSSIASKLSMVKAGYFVDNYIQHFVSKPARRAPLINRLATILRHANLLHDSPTVYLAQVDAVFCAFEFHSRGYYIRMKAIDSILQSFLSCYHREAVQIVSFGAGFDTSYFRLNQQGKLESCKYFEVDLVPVVKNKIAVINRVANLVSGVQIQEEDNLQTPNYSLLGCDLTELLALQQKLESSGVEYEKPTLFLSECVLTYVEAEKVDLLLSWCASRFKNSIFCCYEQIHPFDGFGRIMQDHFSSLQSPLKNITHFPTRYEQEQRYKKSGWKDTFSCDMNCFYCSLPLSEQKRVCSLDIFDEYEEWHMKCRHYMLLCASNGKCSSLAERMIPSQDQPIQCLESSKLSLLQISTEGTEEITRYAHSSVELSGSGILITGGFGRSRSSPVHRRLDNVLILKPSCVKKSWLCNSLPSTGTKPGPLMHHTTTLLENGRVLLCGGRTSPVLANSVFYVCEMETENAHWSVVSRDVMSDKFEPRWRHSTSRILDSKGIESVVIIGGCSSSSKALCDCYALNTSTWMLKKLDVVLSEGMHSHCAVVDSNKIFVFGGLNSTMTPLSSSFFITTTLEKWVLNDFELSPPLPPGYGMAGCVKDDNILLVGGIWQFDANSFIVINIRNGIWMRYRLESPGCNSSQLLMCNHTCHCMDDTVLVIGGGGNCFSFGTHLNLHLHKIDFC